MLRKQPFIYLIYILYSLVINISFTLRVDAQVEVSQIANEGQEMGNLTIKNFTYDQYKGGPWIKDIVQDEQGLVYFASQETTPVVHTFDGTSFKTITIPNFDSRITSLLVEKDTLFLGSSSGKREFGFVTKDELGQYNGNNYISIQDKLSEDLNTLKGIWSIKKLKNSIYFLIEGWGLVRWQQGAITKIPIPGVYRQMFVFRDKLYIPAGGQLYSLDNNSLTKINWQAGTLQAMLPYDNEHVLVITTGHQQFGLFDGYNYTQIFQHLPRIDRLWYGLAIDSGYYILGTGGNGLMILSRQGKIVNILNKTSGLADNIISGLLLTKDHSILVSTNNGMSKFNFPNPFSFYELDNTVNALIRYQDTLFVGSRLGLYRLEKSTNNSFHPKFLRIKNANWWVKTLFKVNGGFLIGTNRGGLYFYKNGKIKLIDKATIPINYQDIHQFNKVPELFLIKTFTTLDLMEFKYGRFNYLGEIKKMPGEPSIVEDNFGNIFVNSNLETYKLQIHSPFLENKEIKKALLDNHFDFRPYPKNIATCVVDDTLVSMANSGFGREYHNRYYNNKLDSFVPYNKFKSEFDKDETIVGYFLQANNGDIYMMRLAKTPLVYGDSISKRIKTLRWHVKAKKQPDGSYMWDNDSFQGLTEISNGAMLIYPEDNDIVWFGERTGRIIRFNPNMQFVPPKYFKVFINAVNAINSDSIIYQSYAETNKPIVLPIEKNNLRLGYSALSFIQSDSIYYRYQLKGFDRVWSNWTHDTQKDYTGLGPGNYTFKVQAVHPWLQTSAITEMAITILPPWYLTWWAYLGYAFLIGTAIYSIVKLRVRQLEKDKMKLENIIYERTLQLQEQAIHLKEMDNIKTRFFANISHEFRTPLTLILGPLTKLYQDNFEGNIKNVYDMMLRNAKRLQQLINDLLELSKLESGKLKLKTSKTDFVKFMRMMLANYTSLAETRNINYKFRSFIEAQEVYIDQTKVEQILHNLLSNAFKFTESGGKVKVFLKITAEDDRPYMEVLVEDSGIGIPKKQLDKIFERFYQADTINYSNQQGTGIGLALAKELVELHYGKLTVKSIEGKGTTFRLLLPLGREHLREDEIIESSTDVILPSLFENIESGIHKNKPHEVVKTIKPNVLVVEDNADMRAFIRLILKQDYKLYEAKNGVEGLELAIKKEPQIIVSDVMMPKMDGISLCQKLKTDWRTSHIPVVLLTAKADIDSKLKGLESRADDYLTKPFNEQELRLIIRNRIQQREALRERWSRIVKLEPKELCITSADEKFLNKLTDIIERNIDNGDLGVEKLISDIGVSRTQLHRKLKALTNQSTTEFIRTFRLKRAYDLILKNAGSISEIAYKVGFSSPQYFNRAFRNQFGFAPGQINK